MSAHLALWIGMGIFFVLILMSLSELNNKIDKLIKKEDPNLLPGKTTERK